LNKQWLNKHSAAALATLLGNQAETDLSCPRGAPSVGVGSGLGPSCIFARSHSKLDMAGLGFLLPCWYFG
jgi:hypothetical protein